MGEAKRGSVAVATLGCKVNQYESQLLKEEFAAAGYVIVGDYDQADIYIINTCSVTNLSDRKSRQLIRKAIRNNPDCTIAVTGCFAQIKPEEIAAIPGVDIVVGTNEKNRLPAYIEEYRNEQANNAQIHIKKYEELKYYDRGKPITGMDSRTRAFIKIQEGCDRFCSYCIIPYARGSSRSRALSDIIEEAEGLVKRGFKELVLTGINTALYGMEDGFFRDLEGCGVEIVIKAINEIPGDFRTRLGSLEPTVVDAEYAGHLLKYEKLCPHMHLSLQSGSDKILRLMNRNYDREGYLDIVNVLREHDPGFGISTDIIVGFPGEEEEDFEDTVRIVKEAGFCKVHVFPYSEREGTAAAGFNQSVPSITKNKRCAILMDVAEQTADQFFKSCIGQTRTVLFERYDGKTGSLEGYTDNYIRVYCRSDKSLIKEFAQVELTKVCGDAMEGVIVK